jgi:serine/threonine-protein kinase
MASGATAGGAEAMNSPTMTARARLRQGYGEPGTEMGMILGTAAYMAPEQAKGRAVDKRADIWAFGVVLYQMLAGTRPFGGDDVTDVLAAVVRAEPDWNALPADAPPRIRELLRRCLTKDVKRRLHDIADARLEVDDAISRAAEPQPVAVTSEPSRRRERLAWTVALVVLAAALVVLGSIAHFGRGSSQTAQEVTRALISVAPADQLGTSTTSEGRPTRTAMALSPDGRWLVFSAVSGEQRQLYLRALEHLGAVSMPGTEGADSPFFSPDGKWVGFWANGALRKVARSGGPATKVCDVAGIYGASWGSNDNIVFARASGGLWLVPSVGGTPQPVTKLDPKSGEYSHRLPQFLPDGKTVVFTVVDHYLPDWRRARLSVVSLTTGERSDLGEGADARYATSGHLVFARSGTLVAARFDPTTRKTGRGLTMLDDLMQSANTTAGSSEIGAGQFSLSASGSLVYLPGGIFPDREGTILSVDRKGTEQALPVPVRPYYMPRLSPERRQLLVWTQGVDRNLWACDIAGGPTTRLTSEGRNSRGIWTPDGKRIVFANSSGGADNLFWRLADGNGPVERLTTSTHSQFPSSWTRDGRTLAYVERVTARSAATDQGVPSLSYDILAISPDGDRRPTPILATRAEETYAEFSPDGRHLAYVSDESGRNEVYVRPYPGPGRVWPISKQGGFAPAWSQDGRELLYVKAVDSGIHMMAASITTTPAFAVGTTSKLFEGRYGMSSPIRGYDVTADGQRFYFTQFKERQPIRATQMIYVQNWFEELRAKVPGGVAK